MCNACGIRYRRKYFSPNRPNPIYLLPRAVKLSPLIRVENAKAKDLSLPAVRPKKMQIQYLLDD